MGQICHSYSRKGPFLGLLAVLILSSAPDAFAAWPSGAVKLPPSKLTKKSGFYCGNVKKSSWIPGKMLSGDYFYSHQAERANLAKASKKASKKKRAKIQKQIAILDGFVETRSSQCAGGGRETTGVSNALWSMRP